MRLPDGNKPQVNSMAVYHLKASIGSRGGGQSAAAKNAYICREGRYAGDADELLYREDGNMPQWAQDEPGHYWQAADDGERANGSLYREVQFALPQELSEAEQVDLARRFAKSLTTNGERLPYTLAVHRGDGENPHAHLVISERVNDGQARTPETWFKRHNRQAPEHGGARKSRAAMPREWLTNTRKDWERRANEALERSGSQERIDSRSWADRREDAMKRGDLEEAARCSRQPNVHLGPKELRHHDGKEQKDQRVRGENEGRRRPGTRAPSEIAEQKTVIERIEQELRRIGQEISRLAKRVVELAIGVPGDRAPRGAGASGSRRSSPADTGEARARIPLSKLLHEQGADLEAGGRCPRRPGRGVGRSRWNAKRSRPAINSGSESASCPGSERSEYERRESELERQQGRDRGGMSR